jgi:hypothetical protein
MRAPLRALCGAAAAASLAAGVAAVPAGGASVPSSGPSAHVACAGRGLLQCSEKAALFTDFTKWTNAFVLDAELFEAPHVHVYNSALVQFWRYETSSAAARSVFEGLLFNETVQDLNFEEIAVPAVLPTPVVRRSGIIDRRTAGAMSALMQAEQNEIINLQALDTSMDRAGTAYYMRGRQDWVKWQQAAAAGFASRAAGAIGNVIRWQRVVTAALMRRNRPFGVGSTDLKLAQRQVRQHGFVRPLVTIMQQLGVGSAIPVLQREFQNASFQTLSFNVSQVLSDSAVIASQRAFADALRHYAARIPPASKPPV